MSARALVTILQRFEHVKYLRYLMGLFGAVLAENYLPWPVPVKTLLEQFLPLAKSHSLSAGLCREDTDLVNSLARPVHIASGGRGASA